MTMSTQVSPASARSRSACRAAATTSPSWADPSMPSNFASRSRSISPQESRPFGVVRLMTRTPGPMRARRGRPRAPRQARESDEGERLDGRLRRFQLHAGGRGQTRGGRLDGEPARRDAGGAGGLRLAISAGNLYLRVVPVPFRFLPHHRVATPVGAVLRSRRCADFRLRQIGEKALDARRSYNGLAVDLARVEPARVNQPVQGGMRNR